MNNIDSQEEGTSKSRKGFRMKSRFKAMSLKKKVVTLTSAFGVVALASFAVAPTTAAWNSAETVGISANQGTFVMQVSTNGGTTWTNTGSASLSFNDFSFWSPGDSQSKSLKLRMSPTSTHVGRIDLSSCGTAASNAVRVAGTGRTSDYSWTLVTPGGNLSGASFTTCSYASTGGNGLVILKPGDTAGVDISLQLTAKSTLTQGQNSTFTTTFTAEQMTRAAGSAY